MGNCAFQSAEITSVIIQKDIKNWEGGVFFTTTIKTIIIKDGVTYLPAGAFNTCYYCEYIEIPATVSQIGEKALEGAPTVTIKAGSPLSADSPNYPWGAKNVVFEE